MIKANCRDRFTGADFDFVAKTLARSEHEAVSLVDLLTDAQARDVILDHPRLVESLLEGPGALSISPQCYFYLLIRHVLKESEHNDRAMSDYLASLLECFSQTARMKSPADGRATPIQYLSDMLIALQDATPTQAFLIRAHVGNYALFLTGIFHDTVQSRAGRGAPNVGYYEDLGSANFRAAASHRVARSAALSEIYERLSASFHEVRLALNHLSESLLHLGDGPVPSPLLFGCR